MGEHVFRKCKFLGELFLYDSFVWEPGWNLNRYLLKVLFDSCCHHLHSLYEEQLERSAKSLLFVPCKKWGWINTDQIQFFWWMIPLTCLSSNLVTLKLVYGSVAWMWNDLWRPSHVEYDCVLLCVYWPGQTAADWDTEWTGQWMQWRAVNRLQIMSPAWGSLTFIAPQTQSTRMVSASLHPNRMWHLIQHQKAENTCKCLISCNVKIYTLAWKTLHGYDDQWRAATTSELVQ